MNQIETNPVVANARQKINTLTTALTKVQQRLVEIDDIFNAAPDVPADPLGKALALVESKPQPPHLAIEQAKLRDHAATLQAGLEAARLAHVIAVADLSVKYSMSAAAPAFCKHLGAIAKALESALAGCDGIAKLRSETEALGVTASAGGLPIEIDQTLRETLSAQLKLVREIESETRDKFEPAGADVRVVALADSDYLRVGESKALPGPVARLLMRTGRVEVQTPAMRLQKAVA